MLFRVTDISPSIELVYDNQDSLINVYPAYHQIGDFQYKEIKSSDWSLPGTLYQYDISSFNVTAESIPLIQLVYYINSSVTYKQQQYEAYRLLTEIETVSGHIYLRTRRKPNIDYRIRFRVLNRQDLAITLNRSYITGIAFQGDYDSLDAILIGYNPVSRATQNFYISVPEGTAIQAGMMPAGLQQRIAKLEYLESQALLDPGKNFRVVGYPSSSATNAITTYYTTYTDMQAVPAATWFKECSILSRPDDTTFIDASGLFKEQNVTVLDVRALYTRYATSFSHIFSDNVDLLEILGLDLLDTRSVTDLSYAFANNSAIQSINLASWITQNVANIEGIFSGCTSLTELDVTSLNFVDLISQSDIFAGVPDACTIWVSGQEQYEAIHEVYPNLTGITYN